jgi:hypothetical protein
MKDPIEIIREYIPGASDEKAEFILENYTDWLSIPTDDPSGRLRKQIQKYVAEELEGK